MNRSLHGGSYSNTNFRTIRLLLLVTALAMQAGCRRAQDSAAPAQGEIKLAGEGEPAVELVIDYGDGVERRFRRIPFKEGMTALGALEFAAKHPRGLTFKTSGAGTSALLTKIDDLANQGGKGGKNWLYRVNGKLADKSLDAYVLAEGDVILWKYEEGLGTGD